MTRPGIRSPHSPERLCDDTIFKYTLPRSLVAAAKRQVLAELAPGPGQVVIFQEQSLNAQEVALYVITAALNPAQKNTLEALQGNEVLVKKVATANFQANQLQFGPAEADV